MFILFFFVTLECHTSFRRKKFVSSLNGHGFDAISYHSIHIIIEKVEFILMALRQSLALSCRQYLSFIFFVLHINKTERKGGFGECESVFLFL